MEYIAKEKVPATCSNMGESHKDVEKKKDLSLGFPGAVVKNPPANAGDTGSSPGPGRSHMPRSS